MEIKGLIFDFDGLILDTESPRFNIWCEIYQHFNLSFDLLDYAKILGSSNEHFNPLIDLANKVGMEFNSQFWRNYQKKREMEMIIHLPLRQGVLGFLKEAKSRKIRLAIASSSDSPWVIKHLSRFGLLKYFSAIETKESVAKVKPHPALYQKALIDLHLNSKEAIAFEDAPHGITSAKMAGLFCVAVPNSISAQLDLSEADLKMTSFMEFSLSALLIKIKKETFKR